MVLCCAISDCPNHQSPRLDTSYFRFPNVSKFPDLNKTWVKALKLPETRSTRYMRVCELHFNDSDFNQTYKMKKMLMPGNYFKPMLKPDAVPKLHVKQSTKDGYQKRKILRELLGDSYWKWKRTVKIKRNDRVLRGKKEAPPPEINHSNNISSVLFVTVKEEPPETPQFSCSRPIPTTYFYCCQFCTFVTRLQTHLVAHSRTHRMPSKQIQLKEPPTYTCTNCDFSTYSKLVYIRHAYQQDELHLLKPKPKRVRRKKPDEIYRCESCRYSNHRQHNLKLHLMRNHGLKEEMLLACGMCKYKTFYQDLLEKHRALHSKKLIRFWCDECGYKTRFKQLLVRHRLKHEAGGVSCDMCEFRTGCEADFKRHVLNKHGSCKVEK